MFGSQIECSLHCVTTKDDCSVGQKCEVLTDDVADGHAIVAFRNAISAKELEAPLVVVVGSETSIAVKRDVVTRSRVHQDAYLGIRIGIDVEVDMHVGRARFLFSKACCGMCLRRITLGVIGDEVRLCNRSSCCRIVVNRGSRHGRRS